MRKVLALIALFAIAISTAVYAENETAPPADPCAGVTCASPPTAACDGSSVKTYSSHGTCSGGTCSYSSSSSACRFGCSLGVCKPCEPSACPTNSKTCADGFTSTCQQTCGGDSCAACEPSCAGHDAPTATNTSSGGSSTTGGSSGTSSDACANVQCNTPPATTCDGNNIRFFKSPGACSNGQCSYPETGYACASGCSNGACNPDSGTSGGGGSGVAGPLCQPIQTFATDASGKCSSFPDTCLPPGWTKVDRCPERQPGGCPPGCDCKFGEHGEMISSFCNSEQRCNYNNVCDKDENSQCRDCIGAECPSNRQCPDGSSAACKRTESGCNCEPCKLQDVPQGCRQETDHGGFVRVVCEQKECRPVPQDVRLKCADEGGKPRFMRDNRGCDTFQCDFGGERSNSPVFAGRANCPSSDAVIDALEKCKELGLPGVIGFEGGCKIGKCQQQEEQRCKPVERSEIDSCRSGGGIPRAAFDDKGCKIMKCEQRSEQSSCEKDLPKEAYDRCANEGGQLVVRRDQSGCVSYSNCLRRGNAEESFVEDINEIPDTTELLSIAFKLEELKLEFDKLAKKTNDIAEYYKSTGSSEEKRFRRVSDMFSSAKDKVDEVKTKLKDKARDIDKDDVLEIKQDLRYLKDVVLKDILFMMLGSGDEIDEIKSGATKDCGSDESCFDRAFRVCQPLTFRPEGREGPAVEVTGLEGDACVMRVTMDEKNGPPAGAIPGVNPPYEMTCKIVKYTLGVSDPEKDVFPYCSGNMVELVKQFGTEGKGAPGVPGKCSGEECKDYCSKGAQEAKECLQYMDKFLPPEAKKNLEDLAAGKQRRGGGNPFGGDRGGPQDREGDENFRGGPQGDFREGEFREPQGDFGNQGDFNNNFNEGFNNDDFSGSGGGGGGSGGGCSGCLNNGVCDPGECSDCGDCRRT